MDKAGGNLTALHPRTNPGCFYAKVMNGKEGLKTSRWHLPFPRVLAGSLGQGELSLRCLQLPLKANLSSPQACPRSRGWDSYKGLPQCCSQLVTRDQSLRSAQVGSPSDRAGPEAQVPSFPQLFSHDGPPASQYRGLFSRS